MFQLKTEENGGNEDAVRSGGVRLNNGCPKYIKKGTPEWEWALVQFIAKVSEQHEEYESVETVRKRMRNGRWFCQPQPQLYFNK